MKETFGLCDGRAEQHCYILVRATLIHVRIWSVSSALESLEGVCMNCADNSHVCNWPVEHVT